jgi:hypothetical protein
MLHGKKTYALYGACLQSDWNLPLPKLAINCNLPRFEVNRATRSLNPELPVQITPSGTHWIELKNRSVFIGWPGYAEFLVSSDGRTITAHELQDSNGAALEALLLGPVMSFALLKVGVEQFHATAVVIDGKAAAFIGRSGYGKSTLAATLIRTGFRLLTDDLLVLRSERGHIWAEAGPKRIKLLPHTAQRTLGEFSMRARSSVITPKLLIPVRSINFQSAAVPLKVIYSLNSPAAKNSKIVSLRRFSKRRAFVRMLANNYNVVYGDPKRTNQLFQLSTDVASTVPVKSLSYPRTFTSLSLVRDAILADLAVR